MIVAREINNVTLDVVEHFASKFIIDEDTGCWPWMASFTTGGYGQFWFNNQTFKAHRFSYVLARGQIDGKLSLDHLCRTRNCVNPNHLEPVTQRENILRGTGATAQNARKTHCKNGHEYNEENTIRVGNGRRCKECCGNTYNPQKYLDNKKEILETNRQWVINNRERRNAYMREYNARNK